MGRIAEWKPFEKAIQPELVDGEYLSGQFTLIAAGPPRLSALGGVAAAAAGASGGPDIAYPLGVVQGFALNQTRGLNRLWEMGSQRSYFMDGRPESQIQITRAMYYGPSLLRMLYAYYQESMPPYTIAPLFTNPSVTALANFKDIKLPAGYENIFLNLASDLFTQAIGLLLYLRDTYERTVAAIYAEGAKVPNHGLSADATGLLMMESATILPERLVPVAMGDMVATVTDAVGSALLG